METRAYLPWLVDAMTGLGTEGKLAQSVFGTVLDIPGASPYSVREGLRSANVNQQRKQDIYDWYMSLRPGRLQGQALPPYVGTGDGYVMERIIENLTKCKEQNISCHCTLVTDDTDLLKKVKIHCRRIDADKNLVVTRMTVFHYLYMPRLARGKGRPKPGQSRATIPYITGLVLLPESLEDEIRSLSRSHELNRMDDWRHGSIRPISWTPILDVPNIEKSTCAKDNEYVGFILYRTLLENQPTTGNLCFLPFDDEQWNGAYFQSKGIGSSRLRLIELYPEQTRSL
jgi:hypothetical protein